MAAECSPKQIFLEASELPVAERPGFLDTACGGDLELRARVEALLAAAENAGPFLAAPTQMLPGNGSGNSNGGGGAGAGEEGPGTRIGPYELLQHLGEGGFGTVWMAEQHEPMRRQVALKILKRGMDSKLVLARFDQERQALAMMDHPNIARVFDGGATASGLPYFVMELVRGMPITQFCEQQHQAIESRLRLFIIVCHAVQHAHHKGVIHRDLKPSNVLVAVHDGEPLPKIIDFGIAKALHGPLTDMTLMTEARQMIGTPEYMSPEQAALSGVDIDTRADIYALGVLLYELLTGTRPFDGEALQQRGMHELLRAIREDEPPKPSTRVSMIGPRAASPVPRTAVDTQQLGRRLRGDLDWIVMKAIEKDRGRRYVSADAFAADVLRHLRNEPVLASPPSRAYRLRKYVRRHRGGVLAAAAVLVTLVAGLCGTTWFALDAGRRAAEARASREQYEQTAASVLYTRAVEAERGLYPAVPERIPAMNAWLTEHHELMRRRAEIAATLRDLEAHALPITAAEQEGDLQHHPQFAAWQHLIQDLDGERRAQAVREGAPLVEQELQPEQQALSAMELGQNAWARVAPTEKEREVHGEEALGLAFAKAALTKPETPNAPRLVLLDTLANAWFSNGRDAEAVAIEQQIVAAASPTLPAMYRMYKKSADDLAARVAERARDRGRKYLERREAELAALAAAVHARRTYRFADPAQQFLHNLLRDVAGQLDQLDAGPRVEVERRLLWATRLEELTLADRPGCPTWSEAAAGVAAPDGVYAANPIIGLRPQLGLVPIGRNPVTHYWEFYHLRSAWDGIRDPATIAIPRFQPDGSIDVDDDTGIVFVLLPGGDVVIGSQKTDPNGPNYDEHAMPLMGRPHTVQLPPFFLARHELTQGQWARLWTWDPALREPSQHRAGSLLVGKVLLDTAVVTYANPVESVDWPSCDLLLRRHGLLLPTEAQWEYGCRAGSNTAWSCAEEELFRYANLADQCAKDFEMNVLRSEAWNDGCVAHGHVGRLKANAFGLYDMHGNVFEWCADAFSSYAGPNGERRPGDACRGACGGGFDSLAALARSAYRMTPQLGLRSPNLGLRASMALQQ